MKKATQWLCYDSRTQKYKEHHIEIGISDRETPSNNFNHIESLWSAMHWKKVYGYFKADTQTFVKSRINNVQSKNI